MSHEPSTKLLFAVRYVMPAVVVLGGLVALIISPTMTTLEGVAGIVGAGLGVALLNWLHRLGVDGDSDRDDEAEARTYFDAHGYWPDEAPKHAPPAPA
ncbi:MAG: hypothetical protein JWP17_4155 [Solirubrobacterales bacterium]|jgi:hypothetical protein|nr:hypothetical protein [Solirubrobacterales bacterium]